jgi:hypothetical protein
VIGLSRSRSDIYYGRLGAISITFLKAKGNQPSQCCISRDALLHVTDRNNTNETVETESWL